jgi:diphosphomevalonate decarboxylase
MRAIILVVSDKEKDTSSTYGMETSKKTSALLAHRAQEVVQPRLEAIEKAYLERDFETFGRITMQDSNQFLAICLDTYPPIFYMNDTSKMIIRLCSIINEHYGCVKAAYTFDAGPNAVIYCLDKDASMIFSVMTKYFPAPGALRDYCNNVAEYAEAISKHAFLPSQLLQSLAKTGRTPTAGDVKYMFYTRSGPGPVEQPQSEALLNPASGLPVPAGPKHAQMKVTSSVTPVPVPVLQSPSSSTHCSMGSAKCCPFSPCNILLAALFIGAGVVIGGKLKK